LYFPDNNGFIPSQTLDLEPKQSRESNFQGVEFILGGQQIMKRIHPVLKKTL
jgi:hypothetical protein